MTVQEITLEMIAPSPLALALCPMKLTCAQVAVCAFRKTLAHVLMAMKVTNVNMYFVTISMPLTPMYAMAEVLVKITAFAIVILDIQVLIASFSHAIRSHPRILAYVPVMENVSTSTHATVRKRTLEVIAMFTPAMMCRRTIHLCAQLMEIVSAVTNVHALVVGQEMNAT